MNLDVLNFSELASALSDKLCDAEARLEALGFTAPGSVLLDDNESILTYKKRDGVYRFVILHDGDVTDLLKTSIRVRILASRALDTLLTSLAMRKLEIELDMKKAIETVDDFLERLPSP